MVLHNYIPTNFVFFLQLTVAIVFLLLSFFLITIANIFQIVSIYLLNI